MERDTKKMRGSGPYVFAQVKNDVGLPEIIDHIIHSYQHSLGLPHTH
jgi:urease accessory protein